MFRILNFLMSSQDFEKEERETARNFGVSVVYTYYYGANMIIVLIELGSVEIMYKEKSYRIDSFEDFVDFFDRLEIKIK